MNGYMNGLLNGMMIVRLEGWMMDILLIDEGYMNGCLVVLGRLRYYFSRLLVDWTTQISEIADYQLNLKWIG